MHSAEYLTSSAYLMLRHFLPEISWRCTLLINSVLFPANMGPMINWMQPLCLWMMGMLVGEVLVELLSMVDVERGD
jgi:hypothetical protein